MGNISKFLIPFPSLEEQKAIVEKVNALMGLCDSLEQQIEHSTTHVEQLMQSCLKEVFQPAYGERNKDSEGLMMAAGEKGKYER